MHFSFPVSVQHLNSVARNAIKDESICVVLDSISLDRKTAM